MDYINHLNEIFPLQEEFLGETKKINEINPLVSVHVITYQHVDYIQECIDGILMQKVNFPIEIVIGEDESTDGTREKCIEYAKQYPDKIRLFLRDRKQTIVNDGQKIYYFNGKLTLKACRGKYIALCEGDDYWIDPYKLQKQVDFLQSNSSYSLCFHRYYRKINGHLELMPAHYDEKEKITIEKYAKKVSGVHTLSVVFKNDTDLFSLKDYLGKDTGTYFLFMLIAERGCFKYFSDPMAVYRVNTSGMYSGKKAFQQGEMSLENKSLMIIYFKNRNRNVYSLLKSTYVQNALYYFYYFLIRLRFSESMFFLKKSFDFGVNLRHFSFWGFYIKIKFFRKK